MAAIFLAQHALGRGARNNKERQRLEDIPEATFRRDYRMRVQDFRQICDLIREDDVFRRQLDDERVLSVEHQVATTLRFLASGTFQNVMGDVTGISQASQSRSIAAVTDALCDRAGQYINFWRYGTPAAKKASFAAISNMPNTLGCIDCTHVAIRAPKDNEQIYVNRKGKHTINVQAVVDSDLHFTNVVARWPGSTHDAFVWENCRVFNEFREGRMPSGWLLGDSGYPLQPWLLTPILRPRNPAEQRFNNSLTHTRVCVERAFGVLKSRFRCLDDSGGILCYPVNRVCKIIISCCILHNICLERGVPPPEEVELNVDENEDEEHNLNGNVNNHRQRGLDVRNALIENWFTH